MPDSSTGSPLAEPSASSRLLKTALAHFARSGFTGARTKAIAEDAGVDEATIFRLFGTKRNLFRAVLASVIESHLRGTLVVDFEAFDRSLSEGIRIFARSFWARLHSAEGDAFQRALAFAVLEDPDLVAGWVEGQVLPMILRLGEMIQRAVARGEADHPRPYIAARTLIDALIGCHQFLFWVGANRLPEFSYENPEEHVVDVWLSGMLVAPEKKQPPRFIAPQKPRSAAE
jgi:AcrR family transcriptional regulator